MPAPSRFDAIVLATLGCSALALGTGPAFAKGVYKSVDADGNITYSDQPPDQQLVDVHRFELPPDLTPEQQAAADGERQRLLGEADIEGTRKPKKASAAEVRGAEAKVRQAKAKLAEYEVVGDDDWGGTQQGKRGLKPAYYARVDAARKELAQAESELAALRSLGR